MAIKNARKIHLNDVVWQYKICSYDIVFQREDGGKKINVSMVDFLNYHGYGFTYHDVEKMVEKGNMPQIKPGEIKEYIVSKLK
jgi:DNA polymerase sigma